MAVTRSALTTAGCGPSGSDVMLETAGAGRGWSARSCASYTAARVVSIVTAVAAEAAAAMAAVAVACALAVRSSSPYLTPAYTGRNL